MTSLRVWRRLRGERAAPEHNGRWADVANDVRLFEGIPDDELARALDDFERRTYEPDRVVVAEGDTLHEIYVVLAGAAAVVVTGPDGRDHEVGRVAPGGTVGEMALLTGEPAAATVRSTASLDLLVLTEDEFAELGERFPQVYRNLGTLLAERLAHTNRLVAKRTQGRLVVLANDGAPPLVGCALACSLAWHTRERTLFLGLRSAPDPDLRALAKAARDRTGFDARRGVAIIEVEAPRVR